MNINEEKLAHCQCEVETRMRAINRAILEMNDIRVSSFKTVTEEPFNLQKLGLKASLEYLCSFHEVPRHQWPRYALYAHYVVPDDDQEIDLNGISDARLILEGDDGKLIIFKDVHVLKVGETRPDKEGDIVRKITFCARRRIEK